MKVFSKILYLGYFIRRCITIPKGVKEILCTAYSSTAMLVIFKAISLCFACSHTVRYAVFVDMRNRAATLITTKVALSQPPADNRDYGRSVSFMQVDEWKS